MKKKLCLMLLVCFTMILTCAACGSNDSANDTAEDPAADTSTDCYCSFEAYGEGMLNITEAGETTETGSMGWPSEPGRRIGDICEEWDVTAIEPVLEGDEFEGWLEIKVVTEVDENDFATTTMEIVSDTLYTTDEVMDREVPDYDVTYMTKWKNVPMSEYEEFVQF